MTTLSAVPGPDAMWPRLLERDDLILDAGMLHLAHDTTGPEQARIDDLLLVTSALEAAGVDVLLIRHGRRTPALAVDVAQRRAAMGALAELSRHEPLYVKARRSAPVLAADAHEPRDAPVALRVFRPRIVPDAGLRYGSRTGVRLELWRFGPGGADAPEANALTRRSVAAADLAYETVERYGRAFRTVRGMYDPQPAEFTGEVDMVFSWVDGSSTDFQRQRAAQMAEYVVGDGDDSPARYRHVDELRYALRSVHMYAPWVRRIFIATDSPTPDWLADHPKVTIVRSEEFFADTSTLPTHNSHAVEAQLHRIPGLAEHFLYSNDDMFFARPVEPEMFFGPTGVTRFVECGVRIGVGGPAAHRSGHDNGLRVNRALLQERFGRTIVRDLEHCAAPLQRSVMAELEREFPDDFARTAASRFRSATDISVTNSLYHYYALFTGRAMPTREPRVQYVQTTLADAGRRMQRLSTRADVDMFCLNDGGESDVPEQIRVRMLRQTLERMFPIRAPWEKAPLSDAAPQLRELPSTMA